MRLSPQFIWTKMSNCLPEDGMANLSTGMLKEICFGQLN